MTNVESPAKDRIGLLVPGMHRSGTSALTRVLSLMGCTLPQTLLDANPTNPAGHWESDAIRIFNDELLEVAGHDWSDWAPIDPGFFASLPVRARLVEAGALLEREYAGSALFVLKDPRIAVLAPFWIEVMERLGIAVAIVCPVRHPVEVAQSLMRRDGIDEGEGHLIWLRHVLAAEAGTRGQRRLYTTYDQLLSNWQQVIGRIGTDLGVVWPRQAESRQGEVGRFLSPPLRHHAVNPVEASTDAHLSYWTRTVFSILARWADEGEAVQDHKTLDEIAAVFDAATPAFHDLVGKGRAAMARTHVLEQAVSGERDVAQQRIAELEAGYAQLDADRSHLLNEREQLTLRIQGLEQHAGHLTHQLNGATESLAADVGLRDEMAALSAQLAATIAERDAARAFADAADNSAAIAELEAVRAQFSALQDEAVDLRHQLQALSSRLRQREEELAQVWADLERSRRDAEEMDDEAARRTAELEALGKRLVESEAWVFKLAGARRQAELAQAMAERTAATTAQERDRAQSALAVAHADLVAARDERSLLRQNLKAAEAAHAEAVAGMRDALALARIHGQSEVDLIASDRDQAAALKDALQASNRRNAMLLDEAQGELATLSQLLLAAEQQADTAREAEDALRRDLASRLESEARLRHELEELRNSHARQTDAAAQHASSNAVRAANAAAETTHELRVRVAQEAQRADDHEATLEWIRQVTVAMQHRAWWWAFMPKRYVNAEIGKRLKKKGLFDSSAYLELYPDVWESGSLPIQHYLRHGIRENRARPI